MFYDLYIQSMHRLIHLDPMEFGTWFQLLVLMAFAVWLPRSVFVQAFSMAVADAKEVQVMLGLIFSTTPKNES